MKNKRIFFGAAALILAAGGFFATKASTKVIPYYYKKGAACQLVQASIPCTLTGTTCRYTDFDGSLYPVYRAQATDQPCTVQLRIN